MDKNSTFNSDKSYDTSVLNYNGLNKIILQHLNFESMKHSDFLLKMNNQKRIFMTKSINKLNSEEGTFQILLNKWKFRLSGFLGYKLFLLDYPGLSILHANLSFNFNFLLYWGKFIVNMFAIPVFKALYFSQWCLDVDERKIMNMGFE